MNPWIYLVIAGFFEILLALGLKFSEGFNNFWPSVLTFGSTVLSFYFLSQSIKVLPIGLAYAVWTGIGAVGITVIGSVFFQEIMSFQKIICIGLIIFGMAGLKFS